VVSLFSSGCASAGSSGERTIDSRSVEATVQSALVKQGFPNPALSCPDGQPLRRDYIFDCTVAGAGTTTKMRITEDDAEGHFHFEPSE